MNRVRGVVMVLIACVAFWRGFQLRTSNMAFTAYGLGVLALALGIWHLTRKPAPPRI